jgi:hypothetical protein
MSVLGRGAMLAYPNFVNHFRGKFGTDELTQGGKPIYYSLEVNSYSDEYLWEFVHCQNPFREFEQS